MNRPLTIQEKRTIRIAAVCVAGYLVLFYGFAGQNYFSTRRTDYLKLVQQAQDLRDVIQPYQEKIGTVTNLMDRFRLDPAKLDHSSVVAQASAAIQQAAASGGVGLGTIRETPARVSAKEAGSIQFEGSGPAPAVLGFLHNLERVGFPVIVDSVQFTSDPRAPNAIKVNLTIVVLDFDAWKAKEEKPNA
jgi:hypothetical protein